MLQAEGTKCAKAESREPCVPTYGKRYSWDRVCSGGRLFTGSDMQGLDS